jgi:hypothetical protein
MRRFRIHDNLQVGLIATGVSLEFYSVKTVAIKMK